MAKIDVYTLTVPQVSKALRALSGFLSKAQAHAETLKVSPDLWLSERLAIDQFPFIKQVQIVTDTAKGMVARLIGVEAPQYEDTESTLSELKTRIEKTLAYVEGVTKEQFDGAEERRVTLPYYPGQFLTGTNYLVEYALPNFYFHLTTTYSILRARGVAVGKGDFFGGLTLEDL